MEKKETVFIAYSGGGASEELSKILYKKLSSNFNIVHYGKRVENGEQYDIQELMRQIGNGKYVIVVVDKKYLTESIYCAEEIRYIINNSSQLTGRLFPIFSNDFKYNHEEGETIILKRQSRQFIDKYVTKNFNIKQSDEDRLELEKRKTQILDCKRTTDEFIDKIRLGSGFSYRSDEIDRLVNNILKTVQIKNSIVLKLNPLNFKQKQDEFKEIVGREWITEKIMEAIENNQQKSIFWLTADAGYGKSAIATLLHREQDNICGIHYVEYEKPESKKIIRFLHTMINQLTENYDWYRIVIPSKMFEDNKIDDIFDYFIYNPFAEDTKKSYWYIIDGIDEAYDDEKNNLAEFIGNRFKRLPSNFKIIILGRKEERIMELLSDAFVIDLQEYQYANKQDCSKLIEKELKTLINDESEINNIKNKLLEVSEVNMLYLEKFFEAVNDKREEDINITKPESFPMGLPGIYAGYFKRIANKDLYRNKYAPLLELIVAYNEPVPKLLIQDILNINEFDLDDMLNDFGTLIKESDNRVFLYHRSLYEWLLNIVSDRRSTYRINLNKGKKTLIDFLSSLNGVTYKKEYINFFHLNRKLIDYLVIQETKDLSLFFDMIKEVEKKIKILELNRLVDYYIVNNNTIIAQKLINEVANESEVFNNPENIEEFEMYIKTILYQIKVYDNLHKWALPQKEKLLELLRDNNNYDKSDLLAKYYIDVLVTISYDYEAQDDKEKTLEVKLEAYNVSEKKYKDENKWYLSYIKAMRALAYTYENSENDKVKFLDLAHKYKQISYSLILKHKDDSYEWKKAFIGILNDLSYHYQRKAQYTRNKKEKEENLTRALQYSEEAYLNVEKYFNKENMIWLELFLKTLHTKAQVLFKRANIDNKDTEVALKIQQDSFELIKKYYGKMPERWLLGYAKASNNLAFVYSDYIIDKDIFIYYSDLSNSLYEKLYESNSRKYVSDCIRHFGQMRGKYKKFNLQDKINSAENTIEEMLDSEIEKNSDTWANAYTDYLKFNFKHQKEIRESKKSRVYTALCKINFDKWFDIKKIKFINGKKDEILIKWIKRSSLDNNYFFPISALIKNINNFENHTKKIFLNLMLSRFEEIKFQFENNNLKNTYYFMYLNNLAKAYLDVKPEPFDLDRIKQFITIVKNKLDCKEYNTEYWDEYRRVCNENFEKVNMLSRNKDISSNTTIIEELGNNIKKIAYSIGDYCKGTIIGITQFGIFVKLESGETALLHISKISTNKINNLKKKYTKGEDIEVVMIGRNNKGILLATKEYYES